MAFDDTCKALSDPTRRQILQLLRTGSKSAGEIGEQFGLTGATISHHLNVLKNAGLVTDERRGQNIVYCLNLTVFQEIMKWFYDFGLMKGDTDHEKQ